MLGGVKLQIFGGFAKKVPARPYCQLTRGIRYIFFLLTLPLWGRGVVESTQTRVLSYPVPSSVAKLGTD